MGNHINPKKAAEAFEFVKKINIGPSTAAFDDALKK